MLALEVPSVRHSGVMQRMQLSPARIAAWLVCLVAGETVSVENTCDAYVDP